MPTERLVCSHDTQFDAQTNKYASTSKCWDMSDYWEVNPSNYLLQEGGKSSISASQGINILLSSY